MDGRKNTFTAWSDEDSDYEIDDRDVNKILIVTQTPPYMRRHPGGDRTGNHTSRAKMSAELAKVINDGLFYYEQDLWTEKFEPEYSQIKVRLGYSSGSGAWAACNLGKSKAQSWCDLRGRASESLCVKEVIIDTLLGIESEKRCVNTL